MIVAVPVVVAVKTPLLLTLPRLEGLSDQVTALLKLPVPVTVGVQADVCVVRIDPGVQVTETDVIAEGAVTATIAEPDLVGSCVEVAVMVAVPALLGVNTPELVTAPMLAGLTDHVTVVLNPPVPVTVGVQADVCVVNIDPGMQVSETDVIAEGAVTATTAEPDLVGS